jgi:serine/threonine-protein kinase Chk2
MSPPSQNGSPPSDTQVFSQFVYSAKSLSKDVEDEEAEGVWGYLVPLDRRFGETLVLRNRTACPAPKTFSDFGKGSNKRGKGLSSKQGYADQERKYEQKKGYNRFASSGYLIGRHPECGMFHCRWRFKALLTF